MPTKKTLKQILTNADIKNINHFIEKWQFLSPGDEEIALLRDIIISVRKLDITTQFVVYTYLTNDNNLIITAKALDVTTQCVQLYLRRWKNYVISHFHDRYEDYKEWLENMQ